MKIQLPLENWADLLPLVPRRQLVELIKQLNDRQFAKILQFVLTEVGQITIGHLRILEPRQNDPNGGGPIVEVRKEIPFHPSWPHPNDLETNLPEGPMPTNVKDFKLIYLSYFDMSVANFLCQFQQAEPPGNFRLDNVNLGFYSSLSPYNNIMPILAQLMPMIGNINSVYIFNFGRAELGPNNAASQLLTTMLTRARILEFREYLYMSMFPWCDWLYAARDDGKPRVLHLFETFSTAKNLIEQIKKDFLKDTRPVSFFVHVQTYGRGNVEWQDVCLDNDQTNERLIGKTIDRIPLALQVLISRYPVEANKEWIEANEEEIVEWNFLEQNRRIHFELDEM